MHTYLVQEHEEYNVVPETRQAVQYRHLDAEPKVNRSITSQRTRLNCPAARSELIIIRKEVIDHGRQRFVYHRFQGHVGHALDISDQQLNGG